MERRLYIIILSASVIFVFFSSNLISDENVMIKEGITKISGDSQEMGRQIAEYFGKDLKKLLQDYIFKILKFYLTTKEEVYKKAKELEKFVPQEYVEEMKSVAKHSGVDYKDILLAHTFTDVQHWGLCSTFVAKGKATKEREIIFARNLDFPSFGVLYEYSRLILFERPGKKKFVACSFAGYSGVLTGVNEDGLCVAVMNVHLRRRKIQSMPYPFLIRKILEETSTLEEAEKIICVYKGNVANNFLICDSKGDAKVFEVTIREQVSRQVKDGLLMSTNHFRSERLKFLPICWRYLLMCYYLKNKFYGNIDIEKSKFVLRRISKWKLTMQSVIILPSSMKMYYAFGEPPSSKNKYSELDLRKVFKYEK